MRPVRLARIAAEAEVLRLRGQVQRTVSRAVMGVLGLAFILAAFAFAHLAVWYWLRLSYEWRQHAVAGTILGGDVVIAVVFLLLAARSRPSRGEVEAREVRQRAMSGIVTAAATSTLVIPVLRVVLHELRRGRA